MNESPKKTIQTLKNAYRAIARDFSQTRQHSWPEFSFFDQYIPEETRILDLGCGNGRFYEYLLKQKKQIDYTGVDFCPEFLEIARKKYPGQEFIEQDMTDLRLEKKYDRIISIAAFHHIPGKKLRNKTLQRIFDHLEDDGVLLLSVWNLWQFKYLSNHLKSLARFFLSFFTTDPRDLFISFGKKKVMRYYHAFIPFELRRLLRKNGFLIEATHVSRYNYLFVCRKNMLSTRSHPLFVKERLSPGFTKSTVATYSKRYS
jgi:SAM-dependent methyltransferase